MNYNPNQKITETQKEAILLALMKGRELTPLDAIPLCGSLKLSSRVSELRKLCWPIKDRWKRLENGKLVKAYKM